MVIMDVNLPDRERHRRNPGYRAGAALDDRHWPIVRQRRLHRTRAMQTSGAVTCIAKERAG